MSPVASTYWSIITSASPAPPSLTIGLGESFPDGLTMYRESPKSGWSEGSQGPVRSSLSQRSSRYAIAWTEARR